MSQETTFTAEQLLAEANRHGGLVADMLTYAATLRQAARVDEANEVSQFTPADVVLLREAVARLPKSRHDAGANLAFRFEAALSAQPAELRAEARQCDNCDHVGINDGSDTASACHDCEWQGPTPDEDKCPGCGHENCMAVACPECGGRYRFLADHSFTHPAAPVGVPDGWKLVPLELTPEMAAAASVAVWPVASAKDGEKARAAALIVLKTTMDLVPGATLDGLAAGIATMFPAYRAFLAAAPSAPQSGPTRKLVEMEDDGDSAHDQIEAGEKPIARLDFTRNPPVMDWFIRPRKAGHFYVYLRAERAALCNGCGTTGLHTLDCPIAPSAPQGEG